MRDRKTLINHIRAAVDWLKEADNSLSNKDDVSGDLKLMLAEAELQRAKERVPLSKRTKRIINLAAVVLGVALAIGTWYLFKDSTAEKAKIVEVHETTNQAMDAEKQEQQPKEETLPETKASEHEQNPVAEEKISESNERAKNPAPQKEEPKQTQEAKPLDRESPPSDEMQKLMESAGKVLRK